MKGISKLLLISLIGFIERFSFYAILSVLFLFMISTEIGFSHEKSSKLYGLFLYCIYFAPIMFGLIADLTNRKAVIGIGIAAMAIGYLLIYFLSGNLFGFYFGLGIAAMGISAFKPNIWVLIGDTAVQNNNYKLAFQGFILFGLIINAAAFFSSFTSAYIRVTYGFKPLLLAVSSLLLISLIIYYFSFSKSPNIRVKPYRTLHPRYFLLIAFIISPILALGFKIVKTSIYNIADLNAFEKMFVYTDSIKEIIQGFSGLFFFIIGFTAFVLLFMKVIKVNLKTLMNILIVALNLGIIFFLYANFYLADITTKSNKLFVTVILIMSLLDIIILPIMKYFVYMFSFRFKGLAFGLFFAQYPIISKFLIKDEIENDALIYVSVALAIVMLSLIIISKKNAALHSKA